MPSPFVCSRPRAGSCKMHCTLRTGETAEDRAKKRPSRVLARDRRHIVSSGEESRKRREHSHRATESSRWRLCCRPTERVLGGFDPLTPPFHVEVRAFGSCATSVRESSSAFDAPMPAVGRNASAASPTRATRPSTHCGARTSAMCHWYSGSSLSGRLASSGLTATPEGSSSARSRAVRSRRLVGCSASIGPPLMTHTRSRHGYIPRKRPGPHHSVVCPRGVTFGSAHQTQHAQGCCPW